MKKVLSFGLCFIIVLCSFAVSFASVSSLNDLAPVILPVSDSFESSFHLKFSDDSIRGYSVNSSDSPVYLTAFSNDSSGLPVRALLFSSSPNTVVNFFSGNNVYTITLDSEYNGYYYNQSLSSQNTVTNISCFVTSSVNDLIDYIDNSVFSTTFDLTYLVDGSISWLSSFAQAVKTNGLLLFFVLFIFVGVGIGLFKRFTNN